MEERTSGEGLVIDSHEPGEAMAGEGEGNHPARSLIIQVKPRSKARPRMSKNGHVYTPKETREYEELVRNEWIKAHGLTQLTGAVIVRMIFCFRRPKTHYLRGTLRESAPEQYLQTPDLDNIEKAVLDALNGYAYVDDKQIVTKATSKCWSHENKIWLEVSPC